ncbi:MAG: indolepyruvate ferredoxin oxidoreductase family protein, partial [Acidimicrobiales bacterium]
MTAVENYQLSDRFVADEGTVFLTGIQALARLPLEQLRADRRAGLRTAAFVSGYQGSPLSGYGDAARSAAKTQPDLPLKFVQGLNEEYGATAVMGSQLSTSRPDAKFDGVIGIWYGKAPGVDRAADALRHAVFAGTSMHGGAVAIVGDDPNAKSSSIPSSSAGLMADMHMPVLYPGDPSEALHLGRHAIALSRATGLWVALKIVADVADATANVQLDPDGFNPTYPLVDGERYQHIPDGRLMTPHTIELEREMVQVRYELARQYAAENALNQVAVNPSDAWIGIVSSGITYREVREALARLGLDTDAHVSNAGIRLLKMGMPLPFNAATVRSFAQGLQQILVIEEKNPGIESLLKDGLYSLAERPVVVGRRDEAGEFLVPGYGALDADTLLPILRGRLEDRLGDRLTPAKKERVRIPVGVQRAPFFCSGCPHNRSTQVPDGSLVGVGIGCHTMAILMDPDRVGDPVSLTAMGNEGTQWIGMADFVDTNHLFQNLGDGTYFHSGQLAIQAAIAAGINITYKILVNGTVAMTGGQDATGEVDVRTIVRNLVDLGVARVIVTTEETGRYGRGDFPNGVDVWDRTRIIEAQEELAQIPGVTIMLHEQACAAEARRARKRGLVETPKQRVVINHRICEGCGDCGQVSNCLSVQPMETPFGRKTHIDQTTCNLDYSCLEGDCPSFMTVTEGQPSRLQRWLQRRATAKATKVSPIPEASTPPSLPEPVPVVPTDDFNMRITGIGGTGVVTVAQVLGTAAMLDGFYVRGLDQIGLSQKAGPVVSDVRLSKSSPSFTNRLGEGQADLLMAFDQLVAGSNSGLLTSDADRTVVVGSTSGTPTGEMITHLDITLPSPDELEDRIGEETHGEQHWADAQAITSELFGQSTTANIFVVGMAVQAGALPISPERVEEAITLNGVAVDANTAAFRWGRAQIADPAAVDAARGSTQLVEGHDEESVSDAIASRIQKLDVGEVEALTRFGSELVAWGDESTALGWLDVLDQVRSAEIAVDPDETRLTKAVAANLFKLTAYKDEYEVARLMLDDDGIGEAIDLASDGRTVAWKLHPPMLRALGMDRKLAIPISAAPMIRQLAKRKDLRGTALDLFRFPEIRQVERELVGEYVAAITTVLASLDRDNVDSAMALAELPDLVRGYEDIKLRNVEIYRRELAEHLAAFQPAGRKGV